MPGVCVYMHIVVSMFDAVMGRPLSIECDTDVLQVVHLRYLRVCVHVYAHVLCEIHTSFYTHDCDLSLCVSHVHT